LLASANSLEQDTVPVFCELTKDVLVEIVTDIPDWNLDAELVNALSISLNNLILADGNNAIRALPRLVEVDLVDVILKDFAEDKLILLNGLKGDGDGDF
jgi:hypothetical protein